MDLRQVYVLDNLFFLFTFFFEKKSYVTDDCQQQKLIAILVLEPTTLLN